MLGLLLRGFFLVGIISWYSAGVWKFIDDYFRDEYKTYLTREFKRNKHLQPSAEVSLQVPSSVLTEDSKGSSPDDVEHLQMSTEVPFPLPQSAMPDDPKELSQDDVKPFNNPGERQERDRDLCQPRGEELDYHNQHKTVDRQSQSQDDDGFINYWHERRGIDNANDNLHCQLEEATCEDN